MFDVIWTDPDRQLVGEHRAKKEVVREKQRAKEKTEGGSHSSSSTRGSTSSGEKSFSFFGSRKLKNTPTPSQTKPPSTSYSTKTAISNQGSRTPLPLQWNLDTAPSLFTLRPSSNQSSEIGFTRPDPLLENEGSFYPYSSGDSSTSKWTNQTAMTTASVSAPSIAESVKSSHSSVVQTLGPASFITVSTEVTVSPRTPETDMTRMISEISISSDGVKDDATSPPLSPRAMTFSSESPDSPISLLVPTPIQPLSPSWISPSKPNNADAWRAPEAWNYNPPDSMSTTSKGLRRLDFHNDIGDDNSMALDLHGMGREIEMMAAADPTIILQRLREVWGGSKDVSLYKEVEMEKKRWMLSALHNMDPTVDTSRPSTLRVPLERVQKVLALYESEAVATYLAATHRSRQLYHMSSSPLSYKLFPNVHPLQVPTVSVSNFPVAPQLFGAVYSLALPSQISSHDIPTILQSIRRCLVRGGTFHITLIDPMPVASSLGPRMRGWLEDHLLLNLERNFRCVNPSKLFPIWLADCSLRGEGSTITTAKFLAIPPENRQKQKGLHESTASDKDLKAELRAVVGRMLWKEVWGAFIGAEKWWWEDPACVEECAQLGTYWEYNLIEAVKEA